MIIYPAIDLIDGQCVRLTKGAFDSKKIYDADPVAVAKSYKDRGATWLHLVDLDGAKNPENRQRDLITKIVGQSGLNVQTGGGIRNADDVEILVKTGAARIVIGSLAVKEPKAVKALLVKYGPEKICLAADVHEKDGQYKIAVSGWQEESDLSLDDFIDLFKASGLKHVLCTDIGRDGMMQGCNQALYARMKERHPELEIQASGGIHALDDLRALKSDGAVIGKALYEKAFTLEEALEAVSC